MRSVRAARRAKGNAPARGVAALVLLLASVVVGPALGGGLLLMHAHGDEGAHEHVLPATADLHVAHGLAHRHAAQHAPTRHHDAPGVLPAAEAEPLPPGGTLVQLPAASLHRPERSPTSADAAMDPARDVPSARAAAPAAVPAGFEARAGPFPARRSGASGALAVLRSSHALRI